MSGTLDDVIKYRIHRAWDTFDDAKILAENQKWNSSINRLYYATFYAVIALLLNEGVKTTTHNGVKTAFSAHFIKKGIISKEYGKIYSQLFIWRQKGDYDDLFDFNSEKVLPYFVPVKELIQLIENMINNNL